MKWFGPALGSIVLGVCSLQANAAPAPLQASDWEGVWAPEPGPPGGRRGGRPEGPPRRQGDDDGSIRLGGPPPRAGGRFQVSEADAAKGLEAGDVRVRRMMTAAGRAAFDKFDPLELPSANCKTSGLPGIALIPELQEWHLTDGALVIRHESYDVERVVDLDGDAPPAGSARSVLGTASGALDGDTLVIDTTNLAAGWGGLGRNAPGSDQRSVRETYRLVDADTIEGEIVLSDPLYLTRDMRIPVVLKRQPEGTTIESFPCDVEVARRHLSQD